jgi:branched-chain amino acid transport system ATP-binding protein
MKNCSMILQTEGLSKSFGGVRAVNQVTLDVQRGSLHAMIGPNGSGKTTFLNLVTKYLFPDGGKVIFKGKDITKLPPHKICHEGIVRCFQRASIYPKLTVAENVRIAVLSKEGKTWNIWRPARSMFFNRVSHVLNQVGLADQADVPAGMLSQGNKKRLELSIALGCNPELLLLDEPTAGMSKEETRSTVQLLRKLRDDLAMTVLFTEHDMSVVFGIAERITVLHQGRIIADGLPAEIRKNDEVQRIYLGEAKA